MACFAPVLLLLVSFLSGLFGRVCGLTLANATGRSAVVGALSQAIANNASSSNSSFSEDLGLSSSSRALDVVYEEVEALRPGSPAVTFSYKNKAGAWGAAEKEEDSDSLMMLPHMSFKERRLFYKLLDKTTNYQEFGCGGSTVVALMYPHIKKIQSVESAADWVAKLRERRDMRNAINHGRLQLMYSNIGPVGAWGFPTDPSSRERWPGYSGFASDAYVDFDFIFVDGRFRVACFLKALTRINDARRLETRLAIHDYFGREYYNAVMEFAEIVAFADTLAVFRKRPNVNEGRLKAAIAQYNYVDK